LSSAIVNPRALVMAPFATANRVGASGDGVMAAGLNEHRRRWLRVRDAVAGGSGLNYGNVMTNHTKQIVDKACNFAHVLRDDGLSYMAYTEQITFLLFLKMADEQTRPPYNKPPIVPAKLGWPRLLKEEGDELEIAYRHILEELGKQPGMLGEIFKKARPEIQNPSTLKRLIVDLIEPVHWTAMQADLKGDIYEGLLAKSAAGRRAGQYFTELIQRRRGRPPTPDDTLCAPAAGSCSPDTITSSATTAASSTRIRKSTCGRSSSTAWSWCQTRPGCAS
jgi:hypothetical protein